MYKAPIKQYMQLLEQWAGEHEEYDLKTMEQVLQTVAKFCQEGLFPTNQLGDQVGLEYDTEEKTVKLPSAFHEVYRIISENGYASLALSREYGGTGAPWVLHHMASEMLAACNLALSTCPMLTNGAVETLIANANDTLKEQYLKKMISGEYAGTMCLTEPQCGTDLGLIKTIATPQENEDYYRLSGNKIWITFGEHDLVENIIHLVLAKTPGAPEGSQGISLFLVPKLLPDGSRNEVFCGGLEHKMGQKASPTALLNFDQAKAWLIGEECSGMKAMFQMMNPARIGVGVQGLAMSEIAYQQALIFASSRRQSRSLDPALSDHDAAADLILVHPDIRRMLLTMESTNHAMRSMIAFCGHHLDQKHADMVGLLTPIIKSYVTEQSMSNASLAMQLMGGMGYVQDGLCEQFYRDGRITMIYEGTNGVQALDLLGRKIAKDGGKTLMALLNTLQGDEVLRQKVDQANTYLLANAKDAVKMAAIAPSYLNLLAIFIQDALLLQDPHASKTLKTFYHDYIVPEASMYLARVLAGTSSLMDHESYNQIIKTQR